MHFWYQAIFFKRSWHSKRYTNLRKLKLTWRLNIHFNEKERFYKKCLLIYIKYIYKPNCKSVSQLNFAFSITQKKMFFSFISLWNKLTFSTGDGSCREVKEDTNLWRTAILFTVNNKNMVCHFSLANMSHIRLLNTDVWPMFCFLGLLVFGTTLWVRRYYQRLYF